MRIGIIIIFHDNEAEIDAHHCIECFKHAHKLEICLVDNNSRDNTQNILKEIKEECYNVTLVNIKKIKSDAAAVRAGARFMINNFDLKHLGFVSTNSINKTSFGVNGMIKELMENQEQISIQCISSSNLKKTNRAIFQNIFSVMECFEIASQ
ncbi:MAG: glycosyltransferase family 2 protein [Flavobacteriaceae bacterium]|nr:glycosyltransferase family 2 protein [Flavobacteriaceae bacterium]